MNKLFDMIDAHVYEYMREDEHKEFVKAICEQYQEDIEKLPRWISVHTALPPKITIPGQHRRYLGKLRDGSIVPVLFYYNSTFSRQITHWMDFLALENLPEAELTWSES